MKFFLLHFFYFNEVDESSFNETWNLFLHHLSLSFSVSAETLQKSLDQMGKQIKSLEKDIETFPPPQSDKDKFVEKMTISFTSCCMSGSGTLVSTNNSTTHTASMIHCDITSCLASSIHPHESSERVYLFYFLSKIVGVFVLIVAVKLLADNSRC